MASAFPPETLPSLAGADWLWGSETQSVLAVLEEAGGAARVVGGAVRNALLGLPVKDVDIATTLTPDGVTQAADAAGFRVIPTGIAHGTVTVIAGHRSFEVTTLRRDVETFGRHATVVFTDDWHADASRRDFTLNALYCDAAGAVFDPAGGYPDLLARRVRFIGEARDRIKEDYLRILRFFRFTAEYANGAPDADGLAAASALQDGLDQISAERIRSELMRLLAAPGARAALEAMSETGILARILSGRADTAAAARMMDIEDRLQFPPDALLRLGALANLRAGDALRLRDRLRLSTFEYERLAHSALPDRGYDPAAAELNAKALIYRHGAAAFRDGALMAWVRSGEQPDDIGRRERLRLLDRWEAPEMPVRGIDVLALGVGAGPKVGRILTAFEDWWIANGFPSDAETLSRRLAELVTVTKA